jgi:hypothetical protein
VTRIQKVLAEIGKLEGYIQLIGDRILLVVERDPWDSGVGGLSVDRERVVRRQERVLVKRQRCILWNQRRAVLNITEQLQQWKDNNGEQESTAYNYLEWVGHRLPDTPFAGKLDPAVVTVQFSTAVG